MFKQVGLLYFLKKNKWKFLHHLYITIAYLMCKKEKTKKITENRIQSHPVGIWSPLHLLGHGSKGKSHYHLCKLTLKPLITVLHLPDHHPQKQSVISLPVLRDAKAFQRKAKHHQNIFTMLMLHQHHPYLITLLQVQCRSCFKGRKKGNIAINLSVPFSIWI